ncbi:endonuclease III domain-containing protein [Oryzicola mucosus]|uniref:Endonuclease n=1 Tax=Oryzicola mucosus TaxID=2767425 RepID=A0A8J6PS86_9HYPH|nr:endonuclease [Oryzicola mucosus]MBD0414119.1 endonuclease [Oryzicola mucosus]
MFHIRSMQLAFAFENRNEIGALQESLRSAVKLPSRPYERLSPIGQLVKSLLSSKTLDDVSWAAYWRLLERHETWPAMALAKPDELLETIHPVTYAEDKADHLHRTLQTVGKIAPDFDLSFLAAWPVMDALRWLERLPGVGRKVSASVLNFTSLARPAFVADTHIIRILTRQGVLRAGADARIAFEAVMARCPSWSAQELEELHRLMKRFGQQTCTHSNPQCNSCPVARTCLYARA